MKSDVQYDTQTRRRAARGMLRFCLLLGLALVWGAAGPARSEAPLFVDATPADNFKLYWLIKARSAPTIDGNLDEDVWETAAPLEDWGITNYGRQKGRLGRIDMRAAWDDTYLYFGARMYHAREPKDMDEFRGQVSNVALPIYSRECMEIHIDGNLDHATRFQSIMNVLGERMMIWYYDFGWGILQNADYGLDADWDVAGRIEDDHWTLEIRFALSDIQIEPRVGEMFGVNPCWFNWADTRENSDNYWWQYMTWSTHGDSHHDPRLYGRFILVEEAPDELVDGLRLAFPDLDDRTVMIQTDQGFLVLREGERTLRPYDQQLRTEAQEAREAWQQLKELLEAGPLTAAGHLEKNVLQPQDEALSAVETELAGEAELSRGKIAELRATVGEIAGKLEDARWRVKQDILLTGLGQE